MTRSAAKSKAENLSGAVNGIVTGNLTKRRAILAAARDEFMKHGFSAATTDNIQRAADVSKSTLYSHFSNKEALFIAVIDAECVVLGGAMQGLSVSGEDAAQRLAMLGATYLDLILSPSALALLRLVIAESQRFPTLGRLFYESGPKRLIDLLAGVIERLGASGGLNLSEMPALTVAEHFLALLRADAQMRAMTAATTQFSQAERSRIVAEAMTTLLRAYGPAATNRYPPEQT